MKLLRMIVAVRMESANGSINTLRNHWVLIASTAVIMASPFLSNIIMACLPVTTVDMGDRLPVNNTEKLVVGADPAELRCPECGVVESRREIFQSGEKSVAEVPGIAKARRTAAPIAKYEFTLRMKDGTTRQFFDEKGENWRLGERVIVISTKNTPHQ